MPISPIPWTIQDSNSKATDEWSADSDYLHPSTISLLAGGVK